LVAKNQTRKVLDATAANGAVQVDNPYLLDACGARASSALCQLATSASLLGPVILRTVVSALSRAVAARWVGGRGKPYEWTKCWPKGVLCGSFRGGLAYPRRPRRCPPLHRIAPRRCCAARAPARPPRMASVRTEKSQGQIEVTIPILPDLQEAIDAGPTGDLAYICGERGQ
jgi:hypothetical protein